MFGYVKPYVPGLLVADNELYKSIYCGLCRSLKQKTGVISEFTLNYDFVFLALIRMAIEPKKVEIKRRRCFAHPIKSRPMMTPNDVTLFCASVCSLLTYYKLEDDISDEKLLKRSLAKIGKLFLKRGKKRANLTKLENVISAKLNELNQVELTKVDSIDLPANIFGELLGTIFSYDAPSYKDNLFDIGYMIGKFIYIADAAEDFEKDQKTGSYNPFVLIYKDTWTMDVKKEVYDSIISLLCQYEGAWTSLPLDGAPSIHRILKNIMYDGIPQRLSFLQEEKTEKPKNILYSGKLP